MQTKKWARDWRVETLQDLLYHYGSTYILCLPVGLREVLRALEEKEGCCKHFTPAGDFINNADGYKTLKDKLLW